MTQAPAEWLGDTEGKPAPAPLARIQALVNTVDLESGADRLALTSDAQPWLRAQGLLPVRRRSHHRRPAHHPRTPRSTARDARAQRGRSGTHRRPPESAEPDRRRRCRPSSPRCGWQAAGGRRLRFLEGRLLSLLLVVSDAQRDGTWAHLKACGNEDCRWAFYDRSRNHGGTWCDMATCGNKLKNRDFRARRGRRGRG